MQLSTILATLSIAVAVAAVPTPTAEQALPPESQVKPQQCTSAAQAIPSCGRSCLEDAATSVGCGVVDFTCSCPKQSQIASAATQCVIKACPGISSAEAVQSAAEAVCTCVSNLGSLASFSSSSSSSLVAQVPTPTPSSKSSSMPTPTPQTNSKPGATTGTSDSQNVSAKSSSSGATGDSIGGSTGGSVGGSTANPSNPFSNFDFSGDTPATELDSVLASFFDGQ